MKGSCLCGAVKYTIEGALRPVIGCHCVQCRKTSGHYVAATSAPRDKVTVDGDVTWYASSERARRGFCAICGSSLFWDGAGGNLSVHAGTFDDATGLKLAAHIVVGDKGDYHGLDDDVPQAQADDPKFTTMVI